MSSIYSMDFSLDLLVDYIDSERALKEGLNDVEDPRDCVSTPSPSVF